jgi:hypothetical protein
MVESAAATTGSTVTPDDSAAALRLGWSLAEVRGRMDPEADQTLVPNPAPPVMLLDVADERSAIERQIEAVKTLAALSEGCNSDLALTMLTTSDKWAAGDEAVTGLTATDLLRYLASRLIWSRTSKDVSGNLGALSPIDVNATEPSPEKWWERLEWFLWAWDQAIQDQFATQNYGTASSYELGRGLAETYWALWPSKGDRASSWGFLLGEERIHALRVSCKRLAPVIGTLTAGAVEASLRGWGQVAADPGAYVDPEKELHRQTIVWRDLLVTGRDPLTMVDSHALAKVARQPWPLLRAFWSEILGAFLGALLIGLAAVYLSKFAAAFFSALGAVGITASAGIGWAKSSVQKVTDRVRAAVNLDVVVQAVQRLPVKATTPRATPAGTSQPRASQPGPPSPAPARRARAA